MLVGVEPSGSFFFGERVSPVVSLHDTVPIEDHEFPTDVFEGCDVVRGSEMIHVGGSFDVELLFNESRTEEDESLQLDHGSNFQEFYGDVDIQSARNVGV